MLTDENPGQMFLKNIFLEREDVFSLAIEFSQIYSLSYH